MANDNKHGAGNKKQNGMMALRKDRQSTRAATPRQRTPDIAAFAIIGRLPAIALYFFALALALVFAERAFWPETWPSATDQISVQTSLAKASLWVTIA